MDSLRLGLLTDRTAKRHEIDAFNLITENPREALACARNLDGLAIFWRGAERSRLTAEALHAGLPVFSEQPLGFNAHEVRQVVEQARRSGVLLGTDCGLRFLNGAQLIRDSIRAGRIGELTSIELVSRSTYGSEGAAGGSLENLGLPLLDLAFWLLNFPKIASIESRHRDDFTLAWLDLEPGPTMALSCSWNQHLGTDAILSLTLHGTSGSLCLRNLQGSFSNFVTERYHGSSCETLSYPPESWQDRAIADWVRRIGHGELYDPAIETQIALSRTLDVIQGIDSLEPELAAIHSYGI